MKTKAELEAEIAELRITVAGLEAAVVAYQYAFNHLSQHTYWPNPDPLPGIFPQWYPPPTTIAPYTPPFTVTNLN
jgi:hypothetical protein